MLAQRNILLLGIDALRLLFNTSYKIQCYLILIPQQTRIYVFDSAQFTNDCALSEAEGHNLT